MFELPYEPHPLQVALVSGTDEILTPFATLVATSYYNAKNNSRCTSCCFAFLLKDPGIIEVLQRGVRLEQWTQ
jgi:hypothetical protein